MMKSQFYECLTKHEILRIGREERDKLLSQMRANEEQKIEDSNAKYSQLERELLEQIRSLDS